MASEAARTKHVGCDVGGVLDAVGPAVSDYTKQRIRAGLASMPQILAPCVDLEYGYAVDVGCGGGFDSFALAQVFDRVTAFDADPRAIRQAATVLDHAACRHLSFAVGTAEHFAVDADADLVYCNLMSHNVVSRLDLLQRCHAALKPGGWLVYSEISEAYAAREIGVALQDRDINTLYERLCQLWAGFTASAGFRFFDSTALETTLHGSGFDVVHMVTTPWAGVAESRQVWARCAERPQVTRRDNDDYLSLAPDFAAAGAVWAAYCQSSPQRPAGSGDVISALAPGQRFQPFLHLLQMFDALGHCPCRERMTGKVSRLLRRVRRWRRARSIDWDALDGLFAAFIDAVERRDDR